MAMAIRRVASLSALAAFVVLGALPGWALDNTVCTDGQKTLGVNDRDSSQFNGYQALTAASQTRFFRFEALGGRSYSVFTGFPFDDFDDALTTGGLPTIPDTVVDLRLNSCAAAIFASNDDTSAEPAPHVLASRVNFRATEDAGGSGAIIVGVRGFAGKHSFNFSIYVVETTLFSPRWSTFSGFFTSWAFQNTTSSTISGTLRVINGAGTTLATFNVAIPANRVAFTDTLQLAVPANDAGSAIFTHNGPPGGIQADGFIQNFSISPPVIQPVVFAGRQQQ